MHAAVRIYQLDPGSVEEFKQRVNEGFLPIIEGAPGFRAHYALDAGGGRIASVSVFDDRAGAEESTRMAAHYIRKNMASLSPNPPTEVLEGEVYANAAASAGPLGGVTDTVGGATQPVSGATDTVGGVTDKLLGGGEKKS
jgi:heme-degrading monooxygenase HmoA